jgi:hypothetical protein
MAQRMAWQEAGVEAEWIPDGGIRLRAKRPLVLAVSGIAFGSPAGIDTIKPGTYRSYGGKPTSWVQLEAEQPLWIPLSANQKPAPRRH